MIPAPPRKLTPRPQTARPRTAFVAKRRIRFGPAANDNGPKQWRLNRGHAFFAILTILALTIFWFAA